MTAAKPILLAEITRETPSWPWLPWRQSMSPDKVVLCHDGAEVLDYLYCRGQSVTAERNPAVCS